MISQSDIDTLTALATKLETEEQQLGKDIPASISSLATVITALNDGATALTDGAKLLQQVSDTLSQHTAAPAPSGGTTTPPSGTTTQPIQTSVSLSNLTVGTMPDLGGWVPFPATHPFNTDITNAAVNPLTGMDPNQTPNGAGFGPNHLQLDCSIPWAVVDSSATPAAKLPFTASWASESDEVLYPLQSVPIEGGGVAGGDNHCLAIDKATGFLYESFGTVADHSSADNGCVWDAVNGSVRPVGLTSSTASGQSLLPLLLKYKEAAAGPIKHALRVTMNHSKLNGNGGYFMLPASHASGDIWGNWNILGMRLRLKPGAVTASSQPAVIQNIVYALEHYGMYIDDNGASGFITADTDDGWAALQDQLHAFFNTVHLSDFDVLDTGPYYDSTTCPQPAAPEISSFTGTKNSDGTVTLNWAETGASYCYLEGICPVRGTSQALPYEAGKTYTLVAGNLNANRTRATVTVA